MTNTYIPPKFEPMHKIPRLVRRVIITEKLDGTNGLVHIEKVTRETIDSFARDESGRPVFSIPYSENVLLVSIDERGDHSLLRAGIKNRWLRPGKETDNFGFAQWVKDNAVDLLNLGPGAHRGEWWGQGINRGYGLEERRFSLFNVSRWLDSHVELHVQYAGLPAEVYAPSCCRVVPVLGVGGSFEGAMQALEILRENGSQAAPGYMNPEGFVAYHEASGHMYKCTLEGDSGKYKERSSTESSVYKK